MDKSLDTTLPPRPAGAIDWPHLAAASTEAGASAPAVGAPGEELWTLAEHLQIGLLAEDRAGRVRLANRRFCALLQGAPAPQAMVDRPAWHVVRAAARELRDPGAFLVWVREVARRRAPVSGQEFECRDGRVIALAYTPVDQGAFARLWQCQDITEQRRAEQRLRGLAQTDELTGLPNRRYVLEELGREIARFRRGGNAASVLMIDLDGFKQINDAHGHARGDRALRDLAAVLARRCRAADTAARLGGDEFLVILPETKREGCCDIAARLMREIRASGRGRLRVSIGATTLAPGDAHVDSVLARVDRGLYTAKGCGRDCLRFVAAGSDRDPEVCRSGELRSAG
ncbi:MAG: diguanylate cyclase [Halofilum sp. (in: g-proteobacteria)]